MRRASVRESWWTAGRAGGRPPGQSYRAGLGGVAGQAVDEDVDEELEALVGVGQGELVGQVGHGGKERRGQRGDVVAGHVRGLLQAVGIARGGMAGRVGAVVDAGLVDGEAVDGGDQEQVALDGKRRGQAGGAQDSQDPFGITQGVRPHRDAADRDAHQPGVAEAGGALVAGDLLDLLRPVLGIRVGDLALADDLVHDQVQQAIFVADVPVQGGGAGAELLGQAAHAQRGQAVRVEQLDRGGHDRLPADRLAAAAGDRTVREPLEGRGRKAVVVAEDAVVIVGRHGRLAQSVDTLLNSVPGLERRPLTRTVSLTRTASLTRTSFHDRTSIDRRT